MTRYDWENFPNQFDGTGDDDEQALFEILSEAAPRIREWHIVSFVYSHDNYDTHDPILSRLAASGA